MEKGKKRKKMRHLDLHRVPELWDDMWSLWKRSVFYPKNNHKGPREAKKCSLLLFGKSQWKASSPFFHWKSSEVDHLAASLLPTPTDASAIYKRGSSLINDIYLFVGRAVSWYTLSSKESKCARMCSFLERGILISLHSWLVNGIRKKKLSPPQCPVTTARCFDFIAPLQQPFSMG